MTYVRQAVLGVVCGCAVVVASFVFAVLVVLVEPALPVLAAGLGMSGAVALAAEQADGAGWYWWRSANLLRHRNAVADVDALLVRLDAARGHAWMTTEHVFAVLDARDPERTVADWLGEARPAVTRRLGLPERTCAYERDGEACGRPVRAVNARYCERHAREARRDKGRVRVAKHRERRNGVRGNAFRCSLALENSGSASSENGSPVSGYSPGVQNGSTGENG